MNTFSYNGHKWFEANHLISFWYFFLSNFSDESKEKFEDWRMFDDSLNMFCETDGKSLPIVIKIKDKIKIYST